MKTKKPYPKSKRKLESLEDKLPEITRVSPASTFTRPKEGGTGFWGTWKLSEAWKKQ